MSETRNIYFNARKTAGMTQERWSELLGISPQAVQQYESGATLPCDEVVLRMAEATGQQIFCYWHLLNKSRVAGRILPDVSQRTLPEAVLQLLVKVKDFQQDGLEELLRIAADGQISEDERESYRAALQQIRALITAAWELQYAGDDQHGADAPTK